MLPTTVALWAATEYHMIGRCGQLWSHMNPHRWAFKIRTLWYFHVQIQCAKYDYNLLSKTSGATWNTCHFLPYIITFKELQGYQTSTVPSCVIAIAILTLAINHGETVNLGKHISLTLLLPNMLGGTNITGEICLGAHISQGNTYHCKKRLGLLRLDPTTFTFKQLLALLGSSYQEHQSTSKCATRAR